MTDLTIPKDETRLTALGNHLGSRFGEYKKDRLQLEQKWLKNLRQFKGQYDPEVKIPDGQSTAYPKYTRTKVIGTVARLMEMLFPQTEKNWAIKPSPIPDLPQYVVQQVINELQASGAEINDTLIEAAIMAKAKERGEGMSKVVEDQLAENDYVTLARKVVFSGTTYNAGILNGPLVRKEKTRKWKRSPITNMYEATEEDALKPYFEGMSVWEYYPDLSAKSLAGMDGYFRRHVMSRNQLRRLRDRPDFMGERIDDWLRRNAGGNYKEEHWETELRAYSRDRKEVSNIAGRKYELAEWWGCVTGHDLRAAGVEVSEDKLGDEIEANVWTIGPLVIKAVANPYDTNIRPAHVFIFEDDDTSLLGGSLPDVLRDTQLSICEGVRRVQDNANITAGPMLEINQELLVPGQDQTIHTRKIWWREGFGAEASTPAVRAISLDAHIPELLSIIEMHMQFGDMEANLPPPAIGDISKGGSEALRTTGGASMLLGAAALPIRDTVRNFDRFTTSVINSLVDWNMEFNTSEAIKGDYEVIARGSTSLIAKEVLAQALDYLATTLTDEERMHVNTRKLLTKRMQVRDLPIDEVLDTLEEANQKLANQAQVASDQQSQQAELIRSQIQEAMASAFKNVAQGRAADAASTAQTFTAVMEGIDLATAEPESEGSGSS